MIKIKKYKIGKKGLRGLTITLPKVWVEDMRLKLGDVINIYRDEKDQLILYPENRKYPEKLEKQVS